MAAYVTAAELRAIVPNQFRDAALADSGGGDTADPGLLNAVLEAACEEVDALIEGRVRLPVDKPAKKLRIAARYIALQVLFIRRGLELPKDAFEVVNFWRRWLQKAGEGDLRLEALPESTNLQGPPHSGAITSRPAITGSGGLIGCIAFCVALSVGAARAQVQPRTWAFELPKGDAFESADYVEWAQGESVALKYAGAPAESRNVRWQIVSGTNLWLDAEASKQARAWTWNLIPSQSAIPAGRYDGRIMVYSPDGEFIRVAAQQSIIVHASPRARELALATPLRDIEHRVEDWMAAWEEHFSTWERGADKKLMDVEDDAGAVIEELSAAADTLLAAATNFRVESVGGPLLEDFATAEFRVSGSGWGVVDNGAAVNHGNVIARENTLGLRENFTIAFTNIRSSVDGVSPTATAGANLSDGPFSARASDMAGNTATGLHWSAGIQSGAVGVVECILGTWTGKTSRTFPGYTATTNVHEFLGFVPGSLRATVDADMLARNATGLINPYETTTTWPNLVRNTNVWTKDMDLTCVSPYNSLGSWRYNFTLVTPQHFVFASHWPSTGTNSSLIDGHTLYFVDSTNGLHSREVVKARQVWMDCSVGLLDTPLPAAVTPAKIIDTNDFAKFKGVETLRPDSTLVGPSGMIGVHVRPTYARAVRVPFDPPTPDSNTYWWSSRDPDLRHSDTHSGTNYVAGESGSPVLLCIDGQTVIAQTLYTGGGAGPHIAALRSQIEATMATLGESTHTNLETINLAHWPDYP